MIDDQSSGWYNAVALVPRGARLPCMIGVALAREGIMILVRNVFQAKFGKGGELARQMVEGMQASGAESGRWRILTDLTSGPFDTVVFEGEVDSLAEWERRRQQMFADPSFGESMRSTAELIQSGHAELYTIEGQGGQ
jgi:hypothetical protein